MAEPPFRILSHSHDAGTIIATRPNGRTWTCEFPYDLHTSPGRWPDFLLVLPHRLQVWFACDCAERQHGTTRDKAEMELIFTTAARRWVAGMISAEECDFPEEETVQTTEASWLASQAACDAELAWRHAVEAAQSVQTVSLDPASENLWQRVRLAVLASVSYDKWEDPTSFQAACDRAEEELRPWSETLLELWGVPPEAWDPAGDRRDQ